MTVSGSASGTPLATPVDWTDLIDSGRLLLVPVPPATQPTQASIRRAISTAYYAMFHALLPSNAETLIGSPHNPVELAGWTQIYRNTQHRRTYDQMQRIRNQSSGLPQFSADVRVFADTFCLLQESRHSADYDPLTPPFTSPAAHHLIDQAESATADFLQVSASEHAALAVLTTIPGSFQR